MTTKKIRILSRLVITTNLLLYSLFLYIPTTSADELINANDIANSIQEDVNSQTSAINADTSSAPSADFKPEVTIDTGGNNDASTEVVNTGDNVDVNTNSNKNTEVEVNNNSNAEVGQNVDATADTGNNFSGRNIAIGGGNAGVIITGDASVNVTGIVNANNSTTTILGGGSGGAGAGTNVANTGNGLITTTNANSTTHILVNNNNTTLINQVANVAANTGNNFAGRNIAIGGGTAGVIVTGDATANTNFLVTANGSVVLIGGEENGNDGPGSGATIVLTNSGDNSHFNTSARQNHYVVVNNTNRAFLEQSCGRTLGPKDYMVNMSGCYANTGYNISNRGIAFGGGSAGVIRTGDAVVDVLLSADANNTKTVIDLDGTSGTTAGSSVANTGDNVDVNTSASTKTKVGVNNKSDATVRQNVNAYAITGRNVASRNIAIGGGDAGFIETGNAVVNVTMVADVNNTDTVIDLGGPGFGDATALGGAGSEVINTGDNNSFNTNANSTTEITVNNHSIFRLIQRFVGSATSGLNRAVRNIGEAAGIIRTGNATVNVNQEAAGNDHCTLVGFGALDLEHCQDPATPEPPVVPQEETPPEDVTPPIGGPASEPDEPKESAKSAVFSATSKSADDDDDDNGEGGSVLGAAALPTTGPEWTFFIFGLSLLVLRLGRDLRNYANTEAIRSAVNS